MTAQPSAANFAPSDRAAAGRGPVSAVEPRSDELEPNGLAPVDPGPSGLWGDRVADRLFSPGGRPHAVTAVCASLVMAAAAMCAVLFVAGVGISHMGPLVRWDDRVSVWFVNHRSPGWTDFSYWGTYVANTHGIAVVAVVVTVVLLVRRVGRMAALLVCGIGLELTVFIVTNLSVGRPRPDVVHLGSTPTTNSFPSGHAAATVVLYAGIAFIVFARTTNVYARIVAGLAAVLMPLWVAFSRVYRGQHHLTDVVAGLLLGAVALAVAVVVIRRAPSVNSDSPDRSIGATR